MYRPLPTLSFAVDRKLWELKPRPYRFENLLLHAANGFLIFLLLTLRAGFSTSAGFAGSLLFLFHPAQLESVVWITQRSNLMCLLGMLVGLWFLTGARPPSFRQTSTGFLAVCLALLSKETAVVFPALLRLWETSRPRDKTGPNPWRKRLPVDAAFLMLILGYFFLRTRILGRVSQRNFRAGGSWGNLLIGMLAWREYGKLMIFPFRLTVSHDQYVVDPWQSPWPWVGAVTLMAALATTFILWRNGRRWPAIALAWVMTALLPHLGIIPTDIFMAERFLYVPLVGLAIGVGWAWNVNRSRTLKVALVGAIAVTLIPTIQHMKVWQNDLTLWKSAVQQEPTNAFAHICLAQAYWFKSDYERALSEYKATLINNPSVDLAAAAMNNLADIYNRRNEPRRALEWSERSLRIDPDSPVPLYNKVVALALMEESQKRKNGGILNTK